jgi:hypothetical protein
VIEEDIGEARMREKTAAAVLRSAGFRHEAEGVEETCCARLLLEKGGGWKGSGEESGALSKGVRRG